MPVHSACTGLQYLVAAPLVAVGRLCRWQAPALRMLELAVRTHFQPGAQLPNAVVRPGRRIVGLGKGHIQVPRSLPVQIGAIGLLHQPLQLIAIAVTPEQRITLLQQVFGG